MTVWPNLVGPRSKQIDVLRHETGLVKNLVRERHHPLDLVRELISNAAAREVGARRIEVCYTPSIDGHVLQVADDGCGMDFDADGRHMGRLARFLGLGFSEIVGEQADEFSWKGLGAKLAYQSRQVVIETRSAGHPMYEVRLNEPWQELERNEMIRPQVIEHAESPFDTGTRITVVGHPPDCQDRPFTFDEVQDFIRHRTFVGFTRPRPAVPEVAVSVGGRVEPLDVGFPEFRGLTFPDGLMFDAPSGTLFVNLALTTGLPVRLRGVLTWDPARFGLDPARLNTGLILSSRGIPFFDLPLGEHGARKILRSEPGPARTCLVLECDAVYSEMNLSRSGLVDSAATALLKAAVARLFEYLESSIEYRAFRRLRADRRRRARGADVADDRTSLAADDQNWVVLERDGAEPMVLMREPKNETEAAAILWKLESLGALPFEKFRTVGHPDAAAGTGLFVSFQEDAASLPAGIATFKAQNRFFSYKAGDTGLLDPPGVICWDAPARGRRVRLHKTDKPHKFTVDSGAAQVPIYVMKRMHGLSVLSTRELRARGISI